MNALQRRSMSRSIISADNRVIMQFAFIAGIVLPLAVWMRSGFGDWTLIACLVGTLLAVTGWKVPGLVRPIYIGVKIITYPLGRVVGELMLGLFFYAVVAPIGIALQLSGRDPLKLKRGQGESEWRPRSSSKATKQYLKRY